MTPFNNLRMELKEALDNLWSRISGKFDTVNDRVDDAVDYIDTVAQDVEDVTSQVTAVTARVGTVETRLDTDEGRISDLEDAVDDLDGAMIKTISLNGVNVPKDANDNVALQEADPTVPAWAKQAKAKTSDLTNDGDGKSPFATLQEMHAAVAGQYALIDLQTKSQTSWLTIQEMWDELKKVPVKENRAFTADANCSDLISGGETLTLEGIIYPHAMNYTDTIDRYYYMAFDGSGAKIYLGEFNIGRHPVSGEYLCECLEIHTISDSGGGGGGSGAVNTVTFNGVTHQPDANGNVSFGFTETDPTVPAWAKAAQKPRYTASEVGAKPTQTAVADPTASGTAVTFIDSVTQDANGVITPTKKTVRSASQSESGLMSATDKTKLDGIAAGAQVNSITGVKGDAESSYRTGNVNLTPANIGALATAGGEMTGDIYMGQSGASSGAPSVKWRTADGTLFSFRPYGNAFQLVRGKGSSASSVLTINSDGTLYVNPQANWRSALGVVPSIVSLTAGANVSVDWQSNVAVSGVLIFNANVTVNSAITGSGKTVLTLPSGYKAASASSPFLSGRVNGATHQLYIAANGTSIITGFGATNIPAGDYVLSGVILLG